MEATLLQQKLDFNAVLSMDEFRRLHLEEKLDALYSRLLDMRKEGKQPRPSGYLLREAADIMHVSYPTAYKWAVAEGWRTDGRNTRLSFDQIEQLATKYGKLIDRDYL